MSSPVIALPAQSGQMHSVMVAKEVKQHFVVPVSLQDAEEIIKKSGKVDAAMTSAVLSFLAGVAHNHRAFQFETPPGKPTDSMKAAVQEATAERLGEAYKWTGSVASYKSTILNCLAAGIPLMETEGTQAGLYYGMDTLRKKLAETRGKVIDHSKKVTALAKVLEQPAEEIETVKAAPSEDWKRVILLACEAYGPGFVNNVAELYRTESITIGE